MSEKKTRLTTKQAKFVKGIAEGKPAYKSALEAYDTTDPNVANAIAVENLQKPTVKDAIEKEMSRQGLTMDKIIAPVTKALTATKKIYTENGAVDTGEDDIEMQLKGHDRAVKLMNFGQKKDEGNTINNFGQMIVTQKDRYND